MNRHDVMEKLRLEQPRMWVEIAVNESPCVGCTHVTKAFETLYMINASAKYGEACAFSHCRSCGEDIQARRIARTRQLLTALEA